MHQFSKVFEGQAHCVRWEHFSKKFPCGVRGGASKSVVRAVGRYTNSIKFSVIQAPFSKRGLGESRAEPLSLLARSETPLTKIY